MWSLPMDMRRDASASLFCEKGGMVAAGFKSIPLQVFFLFTDAIADEKFEGCRTHIQS